MHVCVQRLQVLTALLLVRQRQAPAGWAGAVQSHSEVGSALMSLPSGVLALIGEAMTKLESAREARAMAALPRLVSPAGTRSWPCGLSGPVLSRQIRMAAACV